MAGAGSAWTKPKKRAGLRPDALSRPRHPRFVRVGQRYFPLRRTSRARATLAVMRLVAGGESCLAKREVGEGSLVTIKVARLLARGAAEDGRHYRFLGYSPGRAYATHAWIVSLDGAWVRLICPEWHPELAVTVANGALAPMLRQEGGWVACRADLGADAPARVSPFAFTLPGPDFTPERYAPVVLGTQSDDGEPARPRSPNTVILFAPPPGGDGSVYLTGHPPPVAVGERVLFCSDGEVTGSCSVRGVRPTPNGVELRFAADWQAVAPFPAPATPSSGVAGGRHGSQRWARLDGSPEPA